MTQTRRELLGSLGIASAATLLWACGATAPTIRRDPLARDDIRGWLRDAVARLAAVYPSVHVLAVTRQRTTAAVDVLGTGVARVRRDGVVLGVRDRDGMWREQVTSDLSAAGVLAAVRVLVGPAQQRATISFPEPPPRPKAPIALNDLALKARVADVVKRDDVLNSRIVYAASLIDIDDALVWSISPLHDREQRLVRVRKRAVRAAWSGTRPVVCQAEAGWLGGVDDHAIAQADVEAATAGALLLTTPGGFDDGERDVILDPSVTASLVDAGTRAVLTTTAARRPEVTRRLAIGASFAAPMITMVDDPTAAGAYGGFAFDDEGALAMPQPLIEGGRVVGILGDRGRGRARRPGHVGGLEPAPSHLRVAPGTVTHEALREDGFALEGGHFAVIDPSTDRVVIGAARARELKGGVETGRVFAEVELVGSLASILAGVRGVGKETAVFPYRDEVDGEPRWRSVEAPYLRTRGFVRGRRRRT